MVRAIVDVLLGDVGRQILYFYEEHALVINIIVLAYGFFMFYSWSNLVKIYRALVIDVAKQIHLDPKLDENSKIKAVLKTIEIPWAEVANKSPFPYIARIGGLIPKRKTAASVQAMLIEEDVVNHALEVLNGANIKKIIPSYRHMINREMEEIKKKSSS
jgi:hypothetical protein